MIRHNLLVIFRRMRRSSKVFFINLIGLTTGLSCALLIYLWIADELSIDQHYAKRDRIYYAWENRIKADGIWTAPTTSGPTAEELVKDYPEIEAAVPTTRPQPLLLSQGETSLEATGSYVGSNFLDVFTHHIIEGDAKTMLLSKKSIAICESVAIKFFGTTKGLIGKGLVRNHEDEFIISGVYADVPAASSNRFEFLISFEEFADRVGFARGWGSTGCATFVLLRDGVDADALNSKLVDFVSRKTNGQDKHRTLFLQQYADIYLHGDYENGVQQGGRITYIKLFATIAVFILVIACINFMNLTTAKSLKGMKEVGIRKAIGASRINLVWQYLGESLFMSFLSTALALLFVDLFLGSFNDITGKSIHLKITPEFLGIVTTFSLIVGLIAGSYPALYLSGFSSVKVLKGKFTSSLSEIIARKGLVGFQFAISMIMIVFVVIVYNQLDYIQSASLGYERENIIAINRTGTLTDDSKYASMMEELKEVPGVVAVSGTSHNMAGHNSGTSGVIWPGKDPEDRTEFENFAVDFGMVEMLNVQLESGRHFDKTSLRDTSSLIINQAGLRLMGISDPIGYHVKLWGTDMEIVGVCKDFHYESFHEGLKPLFFRYNPSATRILMIKIGRTRTQETLAGIQQVYEKINPGFPFQYNFLDENYQSLYQAEMRVAMLSRYFAGLAIVISCLGLFGLASFTAERRIKEIGIRKVLGSSVFGIVYLLSFEFTIVVVWAIVVATPVSYQLCKLWLNNYAFRISLSWSYFAGAGVLALAIAWLTVGVQAFRASRINPVNCLKED